MKKLATLMLGMSFLVGAAAFAQDARLKRTLAKLRPRRNTKSRRRARQHRSKYTGPRPKTIALRKVHGFPPGRFSIGTASWRKQ